MAVLRSLRTLVANRRNPNSNSNSKSFLGFSLSSSSSSSSSSASSSTAPFTSPLGPLFQCRIPNPILSPLSKWMTTPFHGPLFLSSPPWKLSQLATPLYLQSHVVLLPQVHAQALNLLPPYPHFPTSNLSLKLVAPAPTPLNLKDVDSQHFSAFAESFVNLPNLISTGRLLSGPLLGWMVYNNMYLSAFIGLAISGATDWLDGYMARKMSINSVVGSYLDPLADKVLIGCVAIAMVDQGLLHPGLVGLVVLRDVALVGGALFKRASDLCWEWKSWFEFLNIDSIRPQKVEPLMLSKVNTVFQLVLVAGALLQPEFGSPETQSYINYLSWLVASTTVASTAAYGAQHLSRRFVSIMSKH